MGLPLRILLSTVAFAALLAWAPNARAECPQPYPGDQLVSDLQVMQLSLRNLDDATFAAAGKRLDTGIECLTSAAPSPVFASAYRYIGAWHFMVGNDPVKARRWFRTSLEIDPTYAWDATELELAHPMREIFEDERQVAPLGLTAIEGFVVNQPAGSKVTIDGRPLTEAAATVDRPHVIQQVAGDRGVRGSWLIEGNAIPPQFLRDAMAPVPADPSEPVAKVKKPKKGSENLTQPSEGLQVQTVARLRPGEKTPLLIGGVLGVLGAGGVYAASFAVRSQFEQANTTEDLEKTRTMTNALVVASGGVLLLGAGIGYWGIILDGGGGVGIAGHF
ncbi:MAG: hypothetical protein Q8P18_07860 [Pseudomonadota bacterium]|nr:hypothetical protein [Pseudomonadota bacterium]